MSIVCHDESFVITIWCNTVISAWREVIYFPGNAIGIVVWIKIVTGVIISSSPGVPVVIFSTGKNGASVSGGADEAANIDGGTSLTFVSHTPTPAPNEFDDLVIWLSPNILVNRMVTAGQLP